ncbi:MAG: hypothetical protein HUJ68_14280, partial [Clostridia bacterium]|nr:hypothetical protein [Clostridia bacterium]
MTNKEKKKTIKSLIMVLVTIIILGAIVSVILYLKTDMLKSNKTLFMKYAFNGIKNIEENTSIIKISGNEKEDKYK